MNNWQDPFKDIRKSVNLIQTMKNPMREIRESLMMVQSSKNLFKEVRAPIETFRTMKAPMLEVRKSITLIQSIGDQFKDERKAVPSMQTMKDPLRDIRTSINMIQSINNPLNDVQTAVNIQGTMKDPLKEIRKSLKIAQSTSNSLNKAFQGFQFKQLELAEKGLENIDNTVKEIVDELNSVQTKEVYEGLIEIVKENESLPDELTENDAINVLSLEKFKQLSYKIITGVIIILVSSGLKWEEIEMVVQSIFDILGAVSAAKSFLEEPKEEKTVINNYHIHVGSNEEAMEVIKEIKKGKKEQ